MIEKHLAELKRQVISAKKIVDPYTYFFDHLGEDAEFLDHGKPEDHIFLKAILARLAEELVHKPITFDDFLAVRVTGHPFLHGSCVFTGHLITFFYFEDIATGLAAVASFRNASETQFMRFRGQRLTPAPEPSAN